MYYRGVTKNEYLNQLSVLHERLGGCVFPLVTARKWSVEHSDENDKLLSEIVEKVYASLDNVATILNNNVATVDDNEQKTAK